MSVSESLRIHKTSYNISDKLASNHDQTLPLQPLKEVKNTAMPITLIANNPGIICTKRNLKQHSHKVMKNFQNWYVKTKENRNDTKENKEKRLSIITLELTPQVINNSWLYIASFFILLSFFLCHFFTNNMMYNHTLITL